LEEEYNFIVSWKNLVNNARGKFDIALENHWKKAAEKGAFRCKFEKGAEKVVSGSIRFLAQFIPGRANRRFPEAMKSLSDPFDPSKFNFTKVKECEVLFEIRKQDTQVQELDRDFIVVNNSPLGHCHSLLLPRLHRCLPQVATLESLELALGVMLLSSSPALRVGFNSLLAHASVNHLHFHIYFLETPMLLESIEVQHFSGPCFVLLDYPAPAFVFQLTEYNVSQLAWDVHCLTNHLHKMEIAHNIFFTRGIKSGSKPGHERDTIRVYVWARESTGIKDPASFTPAVCELFGHLCFKTEEDYNSATEDKVANILKEICEEYFNMACESVKQLFSCDNKNK
ncbi:GDP-D-glucose phosphorylase 1, partial [Bacillus rossius redtenbacheri]|uniref:GDP-D-glucose phosphorylase 1 n=1 Tax=Bacillus rossius redtenbacheri TaxID=93214 RepID=UPI002FDEB5BD